ncbi:MAG: fructosamine kinase family protein [Chthonomonadales bacterium]|nr:fructosamine kinase family protein [Chthonomonadales bacterium]
MSELPVALRQALADALGSRIGASVPMTGGMINRSARVEAGGERVFVKWNPAAPVGFYAAEADGLERIRAVGALRVPRVLARRDAGEEGPAPPYLALELVESAPPHDERAFSRGFADALADHHRRSARPGAQFGLDRDNYLGLNAQPNAPHDSWAAFYRDCRLAPQAAVARRHGRMPPHRERRLEAVMAVLDRLLPTRNEAPCLVHGDLWSGNFLPANGAAVVIDPAVYLADREVEMAYVELFGGFPRGFVDAYASAWPLDRGYAHRRPLLQLYPLLVHLNHFGEVPYGAMVDGALRAYVR